MILPVDGRTYAWGADARDLPENALAYGTKRLSPEEAASLCAALAASGWKPFWKKEVVERVVFLVEPGKWRQSLTTKGYEGNTLQVVE